MGSTLALHWLRDASPSWSPGAWSHSHGTRKPSICMLRSPCPSGRPVVSTIPRCGPAGGLSVRGTHHLCRTRACCSHTAWALSVLYRTFGRADGLSRRAQRTASTLIPRALSEVGVVDPAAIATRGLCQAPDTRMWLNQRSKSRRRDFVCFRRQAHRWKGRVSSFLTRRT